MTIKEAHEVIESQYDELRGLGGTFGLFEVDPECTVDYVLEYYFEHAYQIKVFNTI